MPEANFIQSGSRRQTIGETRARAARAATGLESLGVARGDVIALMLRNDFAFFEASIAAGMIGAYSTPINWHYTAAEAEYILHNSTATVLVVHADLLAGIRTVVPSSMTVLVVETPPEIAAAYRVDASLAAVAPGDMAWSTWLQAFAPFDQPPRPSPGAIIYTSGTTGAPKGVMRRPPTAEQAALALETRARAFGFTDYLADPGRITTLICGPLYHSTPNVYAMIAANLGATLILQAKFDAEDFLRIVEEFKVTHVHMVPIMFARLLALPEAVKRKYDVSSLHTVTHGAAPCGIETKREIIDWFGPIVIEYYGSTETSILTICDTADWLSHPGTVGRPVPATELRIIDAQNVPLPSGEIGTVAALTRGIADFTYLGDEAKRQSMGKTGLLTPGDVGYIDRDGYVYLCDRSNDMIISGGVNIYPAEIEAELLRVPGVSDCAVIGIPDDEFGENVCAFVQPQEGVTLTAPIVLDHLKSRLAKFKLPKKFVFSATLPREDSGKIFKRKLREALWEGRDRRI